MIEDRRVGESTTLRFKFKGNEKKQQRVVCFGYMRDARNGHGDLIYALGIHTERSDSHKLRDTFTRDHSFLQPRRKTQQRQTGTTHADCNSMRTHAQNAVQHKK